MTDDTARARGGAITLVLRLLVGGMFVYLGAKKVLLQSPSDFLKVLREYAIVPETWWVAQNVIAAVVPWAEMLLGALLVLGVATRGAALSALSLLLVFTGAVYLRAKGIEAGSGQAFCDIAFDCGCGSGVERICRKLAENVTLILASTFVLFSPSTRYSLWPRLVRGGGA